MIDQRIGIKIKQIRKQWGLSQMDLAERIGLSFQQIQKYEKGATRISVMRLEQISEALNVHISEFIGKGEDSPNVSDVSAEYAGTEDFSNHVKRLNDEEKVLLTRFRKLKNKKIRQSVLKLLQGIAEAENKPNKAE